MVNNCPTSSSPWYNSYLTPTGGFGCLDYWSSDLWWGGCRHSFTNFAYQPSSLYVIITASSAGSLPASFTLSWEYTVPPSMTPTPTPSQTIPSPIGTITPSATPSPTAPAPWRMGDLYPFGQANGDAVASNDAVAGNAIHLPLQVPLTLLGTRDTGLYVDADGAIALTAPPPESGVAFPGPVSGPPFIAAVWAPRNANAASGATLSLDPASGGNRLYYRAVACPMDHDHSMSSASHTAFTPLNPTTLACARANADVAVMFPGEYAFTAEGVIVATYWRSVLAGASSATASREVTVQVVVAYCNMTSRSFTFFRYWPTNASALSPSLSFTGVGFDAGDGDVSAYALAEYGDAPASQALITGSNVPVGIPGLYAYRTDARAVVPTKCDMNEHEAGLNPRFGSITGGTVIHLTSRCIGPRDQLLCRFGGDDASSPVVPGRRVDGYRVACAAPFSQSVGAVPVYLAAWSDGSAPAAFSFVGYFTFTQPNAPELIHPAVRVVGRTSSGTPAGAVQDTIVEGDAVELLFALSYDDMLLSYNETSPRFAVSWYEICDGLDALANESTVMMVQADGSIASSPAATAPEAVLSWLAAPAASSLTAQRLGFRGAPVSYAVNVTARLPTPRCSKRTGSVAVLGARLTVTVDDAGSAPGPRSAFDTPLLHVQRTGAASSYRNWCINWAGAEPDAATWNKGLLGCPNSDRRILTGPWRSDPNCPIGLADEAPPTLTSSFASVYSALGYSALASGVTSTPSTVNSFAPCRYNPTAVSCAYTPSREDADAPAVQCCFVPFRNARIELRTEDGRGRTMRYQPQHHPWRHLFHEVLPFTACCQFSNSPGACRLLHAARPPPFTSGQPGLPVCNATDVAPTPAPEPAAEEPSYDQLQCATSGNALTQLDSAGCPLLCGVLRADGVCHSDCASEACGEDGGDCTQYNTDAAALVACAARTSASQCIATPSQPGDALCGYCNVTGACLPAEPVRGAPAGGRSCPSWIQPVGLGFKSLTPAYVQLADVTISGAAECAVPDVIDASAARIGDTITIRWTGGPVAASGGAVSVRLILPDPDVNGSSLLLAGFGLPEDRIANTGSFSWTVPAGAPNSTNVKVAVLAGTEVGDVDFSVSRPFCLAGASRDPTLFSWVSHPWEDCVLCGPATGTQSRQVQCLNGAGAVVDDDQCASSTTAGAMPARMHGCDANIDCASFTTIKMALSPPDASPSAASLSYNVSWSGGVGNVSLSAEYLGLQGFDLPVSVTSPASIGLPVTPQPSSGEVRARPVPGGCVAGYYRVTLADSYSAPVTSETFLLRCNVAYSLRVNLGADCSGSTQQLAATIVGSITNATTTILSSSDSAVTAPFLGSVSQLLLSTSSDASGCPVASAALNFTSDLTNETVRFGFPATSTLTSSAALTGTACSRLATCYQCGAVQGCAWCGNSAGGNGAVGGSCQPVGDATPSGNGTCSTGTAQCVDRCAGFNASCALCIAARSCNYCPSTGTCSELINVIAGDATCPVPHVTTPCNCPADTSSSSLSPSARRLEAVAAPAIDANSFTPRQTSANAQDSTSDRRSGMYRGHFEHKSRRGRVLMTEQYLDDGALIMSTTDARIAPGVLPLDELLAIAESPRASVTCGQLALEREPLPMGQAPAQFGNAPRDSRSGVIAITAASMTQAQAVVSALRARKAAAQKGKIVVTMTKSECSDVSAEFLTRGDEGMYLLLTGEAMVASLSSGAVTVHLPVREGGFVDCFSSGGGVSFVQVHADDMAQVVDAELAAQFNPINVSIGASVAKMLVGRTGRRHLTSDMIHRFIARALWRRDVTPSDGSRRRLSTEDEARWTDEAEGYTHRARKLSPSDALEAFAIAFPGRSPVHLPDALHAFYSQSGASFDDSSSSGLSRRLQTYGGTASWSYPIPFHIPLGPLSAQVDATLYVSAHAYITLSQGWFGVTYVSGFDAAVSASMGAHIGLRYSSNQKVPFMPSKTIEGQ